MILLMSLRKEAALGGKEGIGKLMEDVIGGIGGKGEFVDDDGIKVEEAVEGEELTPMLVVVDESRGLLTYMKTSSTVWLNQQNQGLSPARP